MNNAESKPVTSNSPRKNLCHFNFVSRKFRNKTRPTIQGILGLYTWSWGKMKPRAIPEKMTIWNRYFKPRPLPQ
jgi:hypothetical protein